MRSALKLGSKLKLLRSVVSNALAYYDRTQYKIDELLVIVIVGNNAIAPSQLT